MFQILDDQCTPTRGSRYSACVDLYAREDTVIGAGETKLVPLGVKISELDGFILREFNSKLKLYDEWADLASFKEWFKSSHYLQLMLRSSLGKKGLVLPNGVGVIDLDYQDEIMLIVHNASAMSDYYYEWLSGNIMPKSMSEKSPEDQECYIVKKGDRVGQVTLIEHKSSLFGIGTDSERSGGFGSTGK